MTAMTDIEKKAQAFATARAAVTECVTALNDGINALKASSMKELKAAINRMAEKHDQLKALIEQHPDLFDKPRTVVLHGVKVGFGKGRGGLEWDDDERVCKAIKKQLPDQAAVLINVKETPSKDALTQLTTDQLKKLGVTVVGTGDQVVIKPTDAEVDKLVKALLKGITEDAA
jgi:hypothetical protein